MTENIFIPSKIRIGFQERDDTYTGKLGYVIYYDAKNKIRKETSFLGWIDSKIPVIEIDNTPQSGFVFNRGVERHNSFSYSTSKIRVFDARDFEFEIDIGNLVEIMKHSDISHQEITEKCVFAWQGKELILLPINSDVYVKAHSYTQKLLNPLNVRSFVPGQSFKNRSADELVYLGEHIYHKMFMPNPHTSKIIWEQKKTKQSFFFNVKDNVFVATNKNVMIEMSDDRTHPQYPDFVENLQLGLKKFEFTDFVQTPMSKDDVYNDVLLFLKEYHTILNNKKKVNENDYNYYYQTYLEFPSHIVLDKANSGLTSFTNSCSYNSNDKIEIQYNEFSGIQAKKEGNSPLNVSMTNVQSRSNYYNHQKNEQNKIKIDMKSLKSSNEEELKDLANKLVTFMYGFGDKYYRLGFINQYNDIISLNQVSNNAIDTWQCYKQWKPLR